MGLFFGGGSLATANAAIRGGPRGSPRARSLPVRLPLFYSRIGKHSYGTRCAGRGLHCAVVGLLRAMHLLGAVQNMPNIRGINQAGSRCAGRRYRLCREEYSSSAVSPCVPSMALDFTTSCARISKPAPARRAKPACLSSPVANPADSGCPPAVPGLIEKGAIPASGEYTA